MADEKTVSLFNRGIRTYLLSGKRAIRPGQTVDVTEAEAARFRSYRDLVPAGAVSTKQKDHITRLEGDNAALKDQVADLQRQLAEKAGAPVVPPVPDPKPEDSTPPAAPEESDEDKGRGKGKRK